MIGNRFSMHYKSFRDLTRGGVFKRLPIAVPGTSKLYTAAELRLNFQPTVPTTHCIKNARSDFWTKFGMLRRDSRACSWLGEPVRHSPVPDVHD